MKARSPVLGYNHNVRYAGRMWHVQTEDSGVQNPHVFTHLFHEGTILATKKLDYEATQEVGAVQKLMQSQHKLMLRELKGGIFDEKIERFFGPIVRDAEVDKSEPEPTPPPPTPAPPPPQRVMGATANPEDERATVPNLGPLISPPPAAPPVAPQARPPAVSPAPVTATRPRTASLTPARPAVTMHARSNAAAPPPTIGGRSGAGSAANTAPAPRAPPPTIGSGRSGVPQTNKPTAEGVVVARPSVIVGKDPKAGQKGDAADFWKTNERRPPDPAFGGDLISEKSLDEVILAYLSEDAPKK